MGILLITSVVVVFANLFADIMYAVVDPRVKYD
jgi:ABC-type dipeptide/oligopeptide/nickel transport system permease component